MGFDVTTTVPRGLAALADRAAALGGRLTVTSSPGAELRCPAGSTLRAGYRDRTVTGPVRVVLADDSYLVRQGTRRLLEDQNEVEVVAAVGTAAEP